MHSQHKTTALLRALSTCTPNSAVLPEDETVAPPKTTWEERQARIARMVESQAFEYSTGAARTGARARICPDGVLGRRCFRGSVAKWFRTTARTVRNLVSFEISKKRRTWRTASIYQSIALVEVPFCLMRPSEPLHGCWGWVIL